MRHVMVAIHLSLALPGIWKLCMWTALVWGQCDWPSDNSCTSQSMAYLAYQVKLGGLWQGPVRALTLHTVVARLNLLRVVWLQSRGGGPLFFQQPLFLSGDNRRTGSSANKGSERKRNGYQRQLRVWDWPKTWRFRGKHICVMRALGAGSWATLHAKHSKVRL